jgi:hypothetical protein
MGRRTPTIYNGTSKPATKLPHEVLLKLSEIRDRFALNGHSNPASTVTDETDLSSTMHLRGKGAQRAGQHVIWSKPTHQSIPGLNGAASHSAVNVLSWMTAVSCTSAGASDACCPRRS